MSTEEKLKMLDVSRELPRTVETSYLNNPTKNGDKNWMEKQPILLADTALHLLQTAIGPGEVKLDGLRHNLQAILIITDRFLPNADLKKATEKLYCNE